MTKKVFIGVGHGGKDPGAVSNSLRESDVNLVMAKALRDELLRNNIIVGISRTKDENDPLTEEIKECNSGNYDLAVEVHNNAGGGDGFEVYYQSKSVESKRLALAIEKQVVKMGQNSRGVKTRLSGSNDYFGWLRECKCPAVLCEGAFVDNLVDSQMIDTEEEQQKFGVAYAKGVMDYLGVTYNTPPTKIYRVQVGAFAVKENAQKQLDILKSKGFTGFIV